VLAPVWPVILVWMSGKPALTLFQSLIGPFLILGGLHFAVRAGGQEPVAGFALVVAVVVVPVFIMTRVAWAAGYAAGRRHHASDPPVGLSSPAPSGKLRVNEVSQDDVE
jgi:hypothetical protein